MVVFRSTSLLRPMRAIPRVRAYSTPTEGQNKKTIEQTTRQESSKAGSNVGLIAFTLVGALAGGLYFSNDELKSYLAGGLAAGDSSVVSQQKEGKMITPFQKKD